jgi:hypothetical protein
VGIANQGGETEQCKVIKQIRVHKIGKNSVIEEAVLETVASNAPFT